MDKALCKAQVIIVTTPNWAMPQGAWGGNEAEIHRCFLKPSDFPNLVVQEFAGETDCYICSSDPAAVEELRNARTKSLVGNPIRTLLRQFKRKFR